MRTNRLPSAVLVPLFLAGTLMGQDRFVYFPIVHAQSADPVGSRETCQLSYRGAWWWTSVKLMNVGSTMAPFSTTVAAGNPVDGCGLGPYQIFPGAVITWNCYDPRGISLIRLESPGAVVVSSTLRRVDAWAGYPSNLGLAQVTQGSLPLPVFSSAFSAGQQTVTDAVILGNPTLSSCFTQNQRYLPRVNVAMVNMGSSLASFHVTARVQRMAEAQTWETVVGADQTYSVKPLEIFQANGLDVTLPDIPHPSYDDGDYYAWFFITADQPFLSWVSTILNDPEPRAMPFAVFPSKAIN